MSHGDPSIYPSTSTTPEPDDLYEIIDDQLSADTVCDARHHIEISTPTHLARNVSGQTSPVNHTCHRHNPPTTDNLSALRKHKRVTIPQCVSSSNTTKRTKGTMKALSHRKLRKSTGTSRLASWKGKDAAGSPYAIANQEHKLK